MEIFLIIILLVISILLFKISSQLKSIDIEANHIHSSLVQDLNKNLVVVGNQIVGIADSLDAIKWEIETTDAEKKIIKKQTEEFAKTLEN